MLSEGGNQATKNKDKAIYDLLDESRSRYLIKITPRRDLWEVALSKFGKGNKKVNFNQTDYS